jgi:hypothetical protein
MYPGENNGANEYMGSKTLEYHLAHTELTTCINNQVEVAGLEQQVKKIVHRMELRTNEMTEMIIHTFHILLLGSDMCSNQKIAKI